MRGTRLTSCGRCSDAADPRMGRLSSPKAADYSYREKKVSTNRAPIVG